MARMSDTTSGVFPKVRPGGSHVAWTAGWAAIGAAVVALEIAALRSGDEQATLSGHARTLLDRSWFTRGVLLGVSGWWVWHVIEPQKKWASR